MTTKQPKMTPQQEAAFRIHRMGIEKALRTTRGFLAFAIAAGKDGDEARKMEAPILREMVEMAKSYPPSALLTQECEMADLIAKGEQERERDAQIKAALTPSLTGRRVAR